MNQDFEHQTELNGQVNKLQSELDALRGVYAEANETILSLRQSQVRHLTILYNSGMLQFIQGTLKHDAAENLNRIEAELNQNRQLSAKIDDLEKVAETRATQYKTAQGQLRVENEKLFKQLEDASNKMIAHEIRQKEQKETITRLFREIEELKNENDEILNSSRSSETSLARSQTEKLKEINALRESLALARADRDNRNEEVEALRSRCTELEHQLDEQMKNFEISGRGEELITRLQNELDQQEELDEKIMSHFDVNIPSSSNSSNQGRLQQLLDRVCDEGQTVLNLSEIKLTKVQYTI